MMGRTLINLWFTSNVILRLNLQTGKIFDSVNIIVIVDVRFLRLIAVLVIIQVCFAGGQLLYVTLYSQYGHIGPSSYLNEIGQPNVALPHHRNLAGYNLTIVISSGFLF